MNVLVIDVGGTNLKFQATGQTEVHKLPSGPTLTAEQMAADIIAATGDWDYQAISIGYPGPVVRGKPALEPKNLAPGWVGYDFAAHFGKPVKVVNDAAMQALGSYDGGRMLFLGLGTGLGSALILNKALVALELAHLPYRKGRTFEDYVGERGLERLGRKKWQHHVFAVTAYLKAALIADYVVIGGGNVKRLDELPPDARRGDNRNAILGGFRLWEDYSHG